MGSVDVHCLTKIVPVLICSLTPKPTYFIMFLPFAVFKPCFLMSLISHGLCVWAYGTFFYWWAPIKPTSSSDDPWSVELIAAFWWIFIFFPVIFPQRSPHLDSLCSLLKHSLPATWDMHALNNYTHSQIMRMCRYPRFFPIYLLSGSRIGKTPDLPNLVWVYVTKKWSHLITVFHQAWCFCWVFLGRSRLERKAKIRIVTLDCSHANRRPRCP